MNDSQLADLYLIGTGIRDLEQLTAEARAVLRRCRKVFHLTSCHQGLSELCADVVDNAAEYWTGEPARNVYRRIADKVMAEVEKGAGVANVIYGHPLFFDDINMGLIERCRRAGLSYRVLPGISSLDTLSTDLEIDYGDGLQVYEAQDLVDGEHPLNPRVHAVILQIGSFGSDLTIAEVPSPPGRFRPLAEYLMRFYPAEHPVTVAFSDRGDDWVGYQLRCPIQELDANRKRIFKGTTLYVPPLASE